MKAPITWTPRMKVTELLAMFTQPGLSSRAKARAAAIMAQSIINSLDETTMFQKEFWERVKLILESEEI